MLCQTKRANSAVHVASIWSIHESKLEACYIDSSKHVTKGDIQEALIVMPQQLILKVRGYFKSVCFKLPSERIYAKYIFNNKTLLAAVVNHIVLWRRFIVKRTCYYYFYFLMLLRVTYSETDRGSNPGGDKIFYKRPDRPWGPYSLLYNE